jgi:two-component system chemotaxis sensor kinase CheA
MADTPAFEHLRSLLERCALELAFVDPEGDDRRRQLQDVIGELTDGITDAGPPPLIQSSIEQAAGWIAAGPIDRQQLSRLSAWEPWMAEAITAWERGFAMPDWPAELTGIPAAAAPEPTAQPPAPAAVAETTTAPAATSPSVQRPSLPEENVTVLPAGTDTEFMRLFCVEAEELLQDIEQGVLTLEATPDDSDTLATVFRAFHTFKGNAGAMKLVTLQAVAHELESLLDAARRGDRMLDRAAIDTVLAGADIFARYAAEAVHQLDGQDVGRPLLLPIPDVLASVHAVLASTPLPAASRTIPAAAAPVNEAPAAAAAITPLPAPASDKQAPAPVAKTPAPLSARSIRGASPSVRVDTRKLDGLVDLVGELVIAESMVAQASQASADEHLVRLLGHLRGITRDLQRTAMSMRMVPIRGAFQKMTRLVRDTAHELGKEIRLELKGEETELDRTVIEEIGDPLVHMIRNAADHGIERPGDREAAGKPAAGTIRLEASHEGGFVVIRLSDDGRGLDPAKLRAKAIERGLIPADAQLTAREALELIFAPGFSTASEVTDLSGRGVGMDVVRRNIERLRGKVEIDSVPGSGTSFTIFMPLTLAIIEGLIVGVGEQRFVIPTLSVRESFRPQEAHVTTVHGRGELVDVRGRLVPLLRLGDHLGVRAGIRDPHRGIVVVVEAGHERRGLLVDELLGKQEVVIKSLGETFASQKVFAGAAILGDGRVGLILDATALVRLQRRNTETAA